MFICTSSHRRLNHRAIKRDIAYIKKLPDLQKTAKENRDKAFERKYGKLTGSSCQLLTQQDYLKKYFVVV